jgi:hypothetical protein
MCFDIIHLKCSTKKSRKILVDKKNCFAKESIHTTACFLNKWRSTIYGLSYTLRWRKEKQVPIYFTTSFCFWTFFISDEWLYIIYTWTTRQTSGKPFMTIFLINNLKDLQLDNKMLMQFIWRMQCEWTCALNCFLFYVLPCRVLLTVNERFCITGAIMPELGTANGSIWWL